jgi:hypothetical protein
MHSVCMRQYGKKSPLSPLYKRGVLVSEGMSTVFSMDNREPRPLCDAHNGSLHYYSKVSY